MAVEERESVTRALVEAVRGIRYDEMPPEACETAHHCLLDFLGVALAGSQRAPDRNPGQRGRAR